MNPELARLALVASVLAGLALLGFWIVRRVRAHRQAREDRAVAAALATSRFTADARRWPIWLVVGALVAFAAVTVAMAAQTGDATLLLLTAALLLFAWLLAAFGSLHHRRGRPSLVMDERGLDHVWYGLIPWSDVLGIALFSVQVQATRIHSLRLGVASAERYLAARPPLVRLMRGLQPKPVDGYGEIEIPLNPLNAAPAAIEAAAKALRARVQPPAMDPWFPGADPMHMKIHRDLVALEADMGSVPPEEFLERMQAVATETGQAQARDLRRLRRTTWAIWAWIIGCLALTAIVFWFRRG